MKSVKAISLWYGDEKETTFRGTGRLFDPRNQPKRTVKLPLKTVRDSDLPMDLTNYCVTITAVDGEVLNSEVATYEESSSHVKLTLPETSPVMLHP